MNKENSILPAASGGIHGDTEIVVLRIYNKERKMKDPKISATATIKL